MFSGSSPGNVRNVAETVSNMFTATSKQSHYQQQSPTSLNVDVNVETHGLIHKGRSSFLNGRVPIIPLPENTNPKNEKV